MSIVFALAVGVVQASAPTAAVAVPPVDDLAAVPGSSFGGADGAEVNSPTDTSVPASTQTLEQSAPKPGLYEVSLPPVTSTSRKVATVGLIGAWKKLGATGLALASRGSGSSAATSTAKPATVVAQVLTEDQATAAGVTGIAIKLTTESGASTPVAVSVDSAVLDKMYGANFASRVRWMQYSLDTKGKVTTSAPTSAPSSTPPGAQTAISAATVSSSSTLMVAAAGPVAGNGTGDFGATDIAQSGQSQTAVQSGAYTYSYPLRTPPSAVGPGPELSLDYNSGQVDGRTGSTNNQTSMVGEGWDLGGAGYIERSYVPCALDTAGGTPATGDLCWKSENATLKLGDRSGPLVRNTSTGQWRLHSDDGSRVEKVVGGPNQDNNGEYWVLTTSDGTKYYFGSKAETESTWTVPVFGNNAGEPCKAATFASSWCSQAWRWNLDYVVDTNGNATAYQYTRETNRYALNGTRTNGNLYIRGGQLARIDYGLRPGIAQAPYRVVFDRGDRCFAGTAKCTSAYPSNWQDVPWDQRCTAAPCGTKVTPTFWVSTRLAGVRTQYLVNGTTYQDVDAWTLTHTFPATGDTTRASLWFSAIVHTGKVGTAITLPRVKFNGVNKQNRVWLVDGLAPLFKYRISSILTETGASIAIAYSGTDCTPSSLPPSPQANSRRCFPQWWSPPSGPAKLDYFHKYVVTQIGANPVSSNQPIVTSYDYIGLPGWKFNTSVFIAPSKRTWSVYAGYSKVRVRTGNVNVAAQQKTVEYTFFRGLDRDRALPAGGAKSVSVPATDGTSVADSAWWAGQVREQRTYNGYGGPVVEKTINVPYASALTASSGGDTSRHVGVAQSETYKVLAAGGTVNTKTMTTYDGRGRAVKVSDLGNTASAVDDLCTTTSYADNVADNLIAFPFEQTTVSAACTAAPSLPVDAVESTRTYYDGSETLATPPARGNSTKTRIAKSYAGSTPVYMTVATTTYDALGRPIRVVDAKNRPTATAYTPSDGGVMTGTTTTNVKGWTSSTTLAPAWGLPTSSTDVAGRKTETTYDALGRKVGQWNPGRPKATNPTPSVGYTYTLSTTAVATLTIKTSTVVAGGDVLPSWEIFDGLLRPRQTQARSAGGGRIIADTYYNAGGDVTVTNNPYYTFGEPGGTIFLPGSAVAQTINAYDGVGRRTATITKNDSGTSWRTTTAYDGNSKTVTPPAGGTVTKSFFDARGNTSRLLQFKGGTSTGAYDTTSYTYTASSQLSSVIDTVGNKWTWTYDLLGNEIASTDPDSGPTASVFEPESGNLQTTTDARGQTLAYTYDELDRPIARYATSAAGTQLAGWTYDTLANGEVSTVTRYAEGQAYAISIAGYTDSGQPTGQTLEIPTGPLQGSYATSFAYGADGTKVSQTSPAAGGLPSEKVGWGFGYMGEVQSMRGADDYVVAVSHTHLNEMNQFGQYASGTDSRLTRSFYHYGNPRKVGARITTTTFTSAVDRSYTYNNVGLVTSNVDAAGSGPLDRQCFVYDYLQRLTQAWTPGSAECSAAPAQSKLGGPAAYWQSYTYDATGNRTSITRRGASASVPTTTSTYTYPAPGQPRPHAVLSVTHTSTGGTVTPPPMTDTYQYDESGNTVAATTGGQTTSFSYDVEGNASTITRGAATQSNVYDVNGRLLLRTDSVVGTTLFLGDTVVTSNPAGEVSAVRTYTAFGKTVAVRTNEPGSTVSTLFWQDTDDSGTATISMARAASSFTRRFVDPFGSSRDSTPPQWPTSKGFLDAAINSMTGHLSIDGRSYEVASATFTTNDPVLDVSDPQQLNGYTYAKQNPISPPEVVGPVYCDPAVGCRTDRLAAGGGQVASGVAVGGSDTCMGSWPVTAAISTSASLKPSTWCASE